MDSKVVFPKIYPSPNSYAFEESVWVNPTQIVRMDYPVKQHVSLNELTFVWDTCAFAGPAVPSKLVRFRLARVESIVNQDVCRPDGKMILVNAAAVWAIQSCHNGTRLYLAQTAATLEPNNGILVLKNPEPVQSHRPDSAPNAIAEALGIELGG